MTFGTSGLFLGGCLLAVGACSSEPAPVTAAGGGGSGGTTAQAGSSVGGSGGQPGSSGSGGSVQAGSSQGGASAGGGAAGSGGAVGGGGSSGASAGGGGGSSGGAGVLAGCSNHDYALCLDFESGIDKAVWSEGSDSAVSTADKAHGEHAYHALINGQRQGVLTTAKFGSITNDMWGRFYLRMTPGAPGGHGNIVGAFQGSEWYELGWQFNGLMGVWHFPGGENPLRSHPEIGDQWYCVELHFDGTKTEMPKWWVDGQEVEYYMGEPNNTKPSVITQFDKLTVGFTTYAGLGLNKEPYGNDNEPKMHDMWLDDIAFDNERIGCITP